MLFLYTFNVYFLFTNSVNVDIGFESFINITGIECSFLLVIFFNTNAIISISYISSRKIFRFYELIK